MASYYYLISSLPELQPDPAENRSTDIVELLDLIQRNLEPADRQIYQCLLYQQDNRNLLHEIFGEYHGLAIPAYSFPAVFAEKTIRNYRRNLPYLPEYMIEFLQDNAGLFSSFSMTDIESRLRASFFSFISKQGSEFLIRFYEWQYQLEKTLAEFHQRTFDFLNDGESLDLDHLEPLPAELEPIDGKQLKNDLAPLIAAGNLEAVERLVDQYYYDFADRQSEIFSAEAVFSYTIKLIRLARWQRATRQPEETRKQFLRVVEQVKAGSEKLKPIAS